jgi:hypothetical protein
MRIKFKPNTDRTTFVTANWITNGHWAMKREIAPQFKDKKLNACNAAIGRYCYGERNDQYDPSSFETRLDDYTKSIATEQFYLSDCTYSFTLKSSKTRTVELATIEVVTPLKNRFAVLPDYFELLHNTGIIKFTSANDPLIIGEYNSIILMPFEL